jgi:hypothetical protein
MEIIKEVTHFKFIILFLAYCLFWFAYAQLNMIIGKGREFIQ